MINVEQNLTHGEPIANKDDKLVVHGLLKALKKCKEL